MNAFHLTTLLVLGAHAGALALARNSPSGAKALFSLNAVVAVAVLLFAVTRGRYIVAARDRPFTALFLSELLVFGAAVWAFRGHRSAVVASYVAFGLHSAVSIAAVLFAFLFKMTRLM